MKFSLIFLLCLVCYGATYQWPQYRNYRTFYEPRLAFYYPALANQDLYFPDLNEAEYSSVSGPSDYADTEARGPVRGNEKQQSRLFGLNNLLSQLINNNNPVTIFPQTTFTSTVLQTSTSTITTTSIKSCISTALFNSAVANGRSTTPCARKRRGIDIEAIEAIEALIGPTPVEPLEKSVAPVLASSSRDGRSDYQAETIEIVSSQGHQASEEDQRSINRQKRSVVTVTSTVTAYAFVGTNVTKFFNLVNAPPAGDPGTLNCLPPGFNVC